MQEREKLLQWLLQGDPAIVYQTRRDLLKQVREGLTPLQSMIEREGWGGRLLQARRPDGRWGRGFHQPQWTATHYTLLELNPAPAAESLSLA
jgi:hypothetical protein